MGDSYLLRVAAITRVQNFKEFYSKHFSGRISPFIAAGLANTPVTANHLTILMIPVGLLGACLWLGGTNSYFLAGGVCFVVLNILDAADGELARYQKRASIFGDYLDRVAHYSTNGGALAGLGFGLFAQTSHVSMLVLGILAAAAIVADDAMRDLLVTCGLEKADGGQSRKEVKSRTRIVIPGQVSLLGAVTLSNVALFHLVPCLAAAQMFLGVTYPLEIYYSGFCLATIVKAVVRGRIISRHSRQA